MICSQKFSLEKVFLGYEFLIHTLSLQKIPKVVVSSLRSFVDMPISAKVSLEAFLGDTHVIMPSSFNLCKQHGRMVIEKTSFSELISATSFAKDNVVLITFNKSSYDRSVLIVFQRLV